MAKPTREEQRSAGFGTNTVTDGPPVVECDNAGRWEYSVDAALARAGLTPLQREVVLYRLEGMDEAQISLKLHKPRYTVKRAREQAETKLEALLEAAEEAARTFPEKLLFCVRDRRTYDERPEGVRGVTPDRSSQRFQGAPTITEDDPRLEQDLPSALKLGEAKLRAVKVPL
jgi:DNA-binding CsgD family transcriptional regulator